MNNFLRLRDVKSATKLSRSSIYQFMKAGKFPKQFKLGERAVAWSEIDVQEWMRCQIAGVCWKAAELSGVQ